MTEPKNENRAIEKPSAFDLTAKQFAFSEEYLRCLNGAKAAELAGLGKPFKQSAWQMMQYPRVRAYIKSRLAEMQLVTDEIKARLADMATASLEDFLVIREPQDLGNGEFTPEVYGFDLAKAKRASKLHQIKKIKQSVKTTKNGDTYTTTEVELHDQQSALETLAKIAGLYRDIAPDNPTGDNPLDAIARKIKEQQQEGRSDS